MKKKAKEKRHFAVNDDCPKCGAAPNHQEVRHYSQMWGDGKVYCMICGAFVRVWDSG